MTAMARSGAQPTKPAPAGAGGRRADIVNRAAVLFDEFGYHRTTMDDIAERVGLAKPSLYHYFRSKDQILYEVHNEMIEVILRSHERRLEAGGTWTEMLRGIIGDVVALMESHPGHLRIFFEHQRELPDEYMAPIREKRGRYQQYVRHVIASGVRDGEFRDIDVDLTTLGVLGISNWTYQWLYPGGRYSAAEVTDEFLSMVVDGLARRT